MPETPPSSPETFYVTTPIYYVNARPHIGHAYTTIAADVLARRHRLLGHDTFFLTGTDEHGQKIERSARAAGIDPQAFADGVSASFRALWDRMGITYTDFIRTTEPRHKERVQYLFRALQDRGAIYKSTYTGQYCVHDEAYVDGPPGIRCPDCGRTTETVSEENFYFRLSAFQQPLLDLLEPGPHSEPPQLQIQPDSRRNEVLSFIRGNIEQAIYDVRFDAIWNSDPVNREEAYKRALRAGTIQLSSPSEKFPSGMPFVPGGLKDLSISRTSFTWGIPVPDNPKHVIYVWLDALANYMTAVGYGSDAPADQALFQKFWPADLHLVGKEIIRFHCVYWPAFLLALNPGLNLIGTVPLHNVVLEENVILSEAKNPRISLEAAQNPTSSPSQTMSSRPEPSQSEGAAERPAVAPPTHPFAPSPAQSEVDGNPLPPNPPYLDRAWAEKMLPRAVTAHGWLLFEESKMSKSRGNIVRTETILDAFGDHYRTAIADHHRKLATGITPNPTPPPLNHPLQNPPLGGTEAAPRKGTASAVLQDPANLPASAAEDSLAQPTRAEADLFASDVLRYFLLREIPFGQDGSFSFDALIERYNADLANGYGNLVSRTLSMIEKNFSGTLPASAGTTLPEASRLRSHAATVTREAADDFNSSQFTRVTTSIASLIGIADGFFSGAAPWKLAKSTDPADRSRLADVLYTAAESIRILTALLYPILPYSTARVWAQLGLGDIEQAARDGKLRDLQWGGLQSGTRLGPLSPIFPRAPKELAQTMTDMEASTPRTAVHRDTPDDLTTVTADNDALTSEKTEFTEAPLTSQTTPTPPAPSRLSNEINSNSSPEPTDAWAPGAPPRTSGFSSQNPIADVAGSSAPMPDLARTPSHTQAQASGLFASTGSSTPIPTSPGETAAFAPQITIDDFIKVDLRVARIVVAERIPKADKLLRLEVELGPPDNPQRRQILSGIAEWYTPEELLGRRIIVIANLAPRKMRGLESHGMLLAASQGENGKPILATFADSDDIPPGARLK